MKAVFQWMVIIALVAVYLAAFLAMLRPHVTPAYKSYFIDRTSSDWSPTHYPGTPEEGMNFGREGLPEWVDSTAGLSARDPIGRWTDSDISKVPAISFTRSFSGTVCVDITLTPAPSLLGKQFAVRMGDQTRSVQLAKPRLSEVRVLFRLWNI